MLQVVQMCAEGETDPQDKHIRQRTAKRSRGKISDDLATDAHM